MLSHLRFSWAAAYGDVAPLLLRLMAGAIFIMHGSMKYGMGVAGVTGFLTSLGFPIPQVLAVVLIATEILGGVALVFGAWTRLAALLTGFVALMATLTVHITKGFMVGGGGYEFSLLLTVVCISLFITGAGAYSIDRMLRS